MSNAVLLPHERANIVVLLGLLALLPAENYDHTQFGFAFDYGKSPTKGCALGLAIVNHDKFTSVRNDEVANPNRSILDRLLGRNKTVTVSTVVTFPHPSCDVFSAFRFGKLTFGQLAVNRVFDYLAFSGDDVRSDAVTKQMVIDRLTEIAA